MRELKFRAWAKGSKTMLTNDDFVVYKGKPCLNEYGDMIGFCGIVMQYSGLNDINGTPIYEGDIVKHKASPLGVPVEFTMGAFRISNHTLLNRIESCEVIGNIYEGVDGELWSTN